MKQSDILIILYRPLNRKAAYTVLLGRKRDPHADELGRFNRDDIKLILRKTWVEYETMKHDIPPSRTLGNQMNAQLACLTLSAWKIMTGMELNAQYSNDLIADLVWNIYRKWSWIVKVISRLRGKEEIGTLRTAVLSFLKFPFSPPGYDAEVNITSEGIELDMKKCLVAEYFQKYQTQDLCVKTWCNQDFAMAEMWGGKLERTTTLVEGCAKCDFRFKL